MSESRRALIIANSDYQGSGFSNLVAPGRDAAELARVLAEPLIGGFEVSLMVNEGSAAVSEAIEEFFVFTNSKPEDFLLLYFSGHGITDEEGHLYLATADTQLVRQSLRRSSAIAAEFVDQTMRRSRSRRQVLILDCCHSGAFAKGMRIKAGPLPALAAPFEVPQGRGRIVLTASTGTQFAFEGPDNGGDQPSLYTQLLVKGLDTGEADRNRDGRVDLDELHEYLLDHLRATAPYQTPTKSGYLEGQLYIAQTAATSFRTKTGPAKLVEEEAERPPKTKADREPRRGATGRIGPSIDGAQASAVRRRKTLPKLMATSVALVVIVLYSWTYSRTRAPLPEGERVNPHDGLTYVNVPAGIFMMGCSPGDSDCYDDERQTHPHYEQIPAGFWLGKTEVTQAAWKKVKGANPSKTQEDQHPVENVDWNNASDYCKIIGGRLPTEKEWEHAARAGDVSARYGSLPKIAWYSGNSKDSSKPVGTRDPNGFGLYDMLGNVWEWTADEYDTGRKVQRGGSFVDGERFVRASVRYKDKPEGFNFNLGFRCVWEHP